MGRLVFRLLGFVGGVFRWLASESPGLMGLGLVCAGVYMLWGVAWTCLAAGAPLLLLYVWRELGVARQMRRG